MPSVEDWFMLLTQATKTYPFNKMSALRSLLFLKLKQVFEKSKYIHNAIDCVIYENDCDKYFLTLPC